MSVRWQAGGDPLPIFTAKCGLVRSALQHMQSRFDLIYVDIRNVGPNPVTLDGAGYLPHLQYTPDYVQTEEDRGEHVLTGNTSDRPVFRFDPAPFYATISGTVVLTGGASGLFDVRVYVKRFAKSRPIRHTLTVATNGNRFARPLGAHALHLPDISNEMTFNLGTMARTIFQPSGGLVSMGPFDYLTANTNVVTFEVHPPW